MAERIPGARYVELTGEDHLPFLGDQDQILDEIEEFLTGVRHGPELDRVLATVLFTDIVGSTETAAVLGDRRWRELLEVPSRGCPPRARTLPRPRGRHAGDGFLATFDGPARAIRCASAIVETPSGAWARVRADCTPASARCIGGRIGGIAVHMGARVAASAGPGEVLVSSTVKDLVAGSGIEFEDRGVHELKGVPGDWRLYAVL